MPESDLLVRPYSVCVDGFDPIIYYAASPGKARAAAWRQYTEAFHCTFGDFLTRCTVRRGKPERGFAEKILVGGSKAYRIPSWRRDVAFVRPNDTQILWSHPHDVTIPVTAGGSNA